MKHIVGQYFLSVFINKSEQHRLWWYCRHVEAKEWTPLPRRLKKS